MESGVERKERKAFQAMGTSHIMKPNSEYNLVLKFL